MDRFHQQILEALQNLGSDQGDRFNECVIDLLQYKFPGIASVKGGNDAGMDGAIPDPSGEPYPLICTIEENVIGNVTRSLESNSGRRPYGTEKAVVVTSQVLTPLKRRNIEDRIREKGYTPVQVFDQEDVAIWLYRSRKWTRELLGLTGNPDVLSVVPTTYRPWLDIDLVGRERDLNILRDSSGDVILTGQPGSGKSYLLYQLAKKGWGLFAVSDDAGSLIAAHRELQPPRIIVDDAHLRGELLADLVRERRNLRADFRIVTSCWPGEEASIQLSLASQNLQVHSLELMTRSEILEIYEAMGLESDNEVLRWLIDQAKNRPGLAVTLGATFLGGDSREVIDGEKLRTSIIQSLQRHSEDGVYDYNPLLAGFAVGGSQGMKITDVGMFLGQTVAELQGKLRFMAAGGIIEQLGTELLAVQPAALRFALLRSVFFSQPANLEIQSLVDRAPSRTAAVENIVSAHTFGAEVPKDRLREWVEEGNSDQAWFELGNHPKHCHWVLERYPRSISSIAPSLLKSCPEATLGRLIETASQEPSRSESEKILEPVKQWLKDRYTFPSLLKNRNLVVSRATEEGDTKKRRAIGQLLLAWAFDPAFKFTSVDPGAGGTVKLSLGFLPLEIVEKMPSLWTEAKAYFKDVEADAWPELRSTLRSWLNPRSVNPGINTEKGEAAVIVGRRMLRDLQSQNQNEMLKMILERMAGRAGTELHSNSTSPISVLFPETSLRYSRDPNERVTWNTAVDMIAETWSQRDLSEVAIDLVSMENDASVYHPPIRETPFLLEKIAELVESPSRWIEVVMNHALPADLLEPLIARMGEQNTQELSEILLQCLSNSTYEAVAIRGIARMTSPPPNLWSALESKAPKYLRDIENLMYSREVSTNSIRALLNHSDDRVRLGVAAALWFGSPEGNVATNLKQDWREAVVESSPQWNTASFYLVEGARHNLPRILKTDAELAFDWVQERIKRNDLQPDSVWSRATPHSLKYAVSILSPDERLKLLDLAFSSPENNQGQLTEDVREVAEPTQGLKGLTKALVDRNVDLYRRLLKNQPKNEKLLSPLASPLAGPPDSTWANLALVALKAGYDPRTVVDYSLQQESWIQTPGEEYKGWISAFENLGELGTGILQPVIQHCVEEISRAEEESRRERRERDLKGWSN